MKKSHWIVCFASFVVGVACLAGSYVLFRDHIRSYGLCYYSFILIAPSLALMTAKVFDKVGKYLKFLSSPLSIFGKSSLEILLASDFVFGHLEFYLLSDRLTALAMIIISIIIGIAFHYCIEFFKNKIEKTLLEKPVDN